MKSWTVEELSKISAQAYSHRWTVGKDYWYAIDGFIEVLRLMEEKDVDNVADALHDIYVENDDYPI